MDTAPSKILSRIIKLQVENTLCYLFRDSDLLFEALQGAGNQITQIGERKVPDGNKRLAMLGDAVISLVVLEDWYETGVERRIGNMKLQRIASNMNLDKCGRIFGLDQLVNGNSSGKGIVYRKTMASTVEALLGAVYLDAGLDEVRHVMRKLGLEYSRE